MSKQITLEKKAVATVVVTVTTVVTITTIAVLIGLAYRFQEIKISSAEVGDILYERLDEYNRAILEDPAIATIITTAERSPGELSEENRDIYLAYQRAFFDGWEAAMIYNDQGLFDADRWNVWDTWHIDEVRRRPKFGWTENRKFYAGDFVHHVDNSLDKL